MFDLPDSEKAPGVADWVELELAGGELSLSKAKVASVVEASCGAEPRETFLTDVWRELGRRQSRYQRPPFVVQNDLVIREDTDPATPEYLTCLLFSLYGVSDAHRSDPKLFERLTAEAVRNYLGGEVYVFGWPPLPNIPTDIANRVREVARQACERFVEAPLDRYKDRGVDVIAWKSIAEPTTSDHRSGQIVMLSQCAAGADWRGKTTQLPYGAWTQYIHWAADPLVSFAVPRVISDDLWHDISREVEGVVFDRIRLVNLLPAGVADVGLKGELTAWTDAELLEAKV